VHAPELNPNIGGHVKHYVPLLPQVEQLEAEQLVHDVTDPPFEYCPDGQTLQFPLFKK